MPASRRTLRTGLYWSARLETCSGGITTGPVEVAKLETPTLLLVGDADSVRTSHAVEFFELLGGGQQDGGFDSSGMSNARLAILPGVTHFTIFSLPELASTVTPFLAGPTAQNQ